MTFRSLISTSTKLVTLITLLFTMNIIPPAFALESSASQATTILQPSMQLVATDILDASFFGIFRDSSATVESNPPTTPIYRFPETPDKEPRQTLRFLMTAYSSTVDQTDGDPFTTASGSRVHPGTVATNHLPFGTRFTIPAYSGDFVYVVEDRHSPRLSRRIDLWMESRHAALQFGVRTFTIHIL